MLTTFTRTTMTELITLSLAHAHRLRVSMAVNYNIKKCFSDSVLFCPILEGIEDALQQMLGQNSRAVCTNMVVMEMYFMSARYKAHTSWPRG